MEKWLFLRSAIKAGFERFGQPPSPDLVVNDDMWTQLFAVLVRLAGVEGIILREGVPYQVSYAGTQVTDCRVSNLLDFAGKFDVVFNRGGYPQYCGILGRNQRAFRVYVGCGRNWRPPTVDLVLVDHKQQLEELRSVGCPAILFTKPAADNVFRPFGVPKKHGFVWMCRWPRGFKGGDWLGERIPMGESLLHIGPHCEELSKASRRRGFSYATTSAVPRKQIPELACSGRVGVVCDDGLHDSGPRVLPEFLAMGIPVIVRGCVRANLRAYITPETGCVVGDSVDEFQEAARKLIGVSPLSYYDSKLSIKAVAKSLLVEINKRRK